MTSRRDFLTRTSGCCLSGVLSPFYALAQSDAPPERPSAMEQWMNQWMYPSDGKDVSGPLVFSRFADPIYFLLKPISWSPNNNQKGYPSVSVPIGFVTDLASIPPVFYSVLRPDGIYTFPAIVHDYLYWIQSTNRKTADDILNFGMQDLHVEDKTRMVIYEAVRLGGDLSWKENARLKKRGEKRILKRFPDDPRTRWADWKSKPGVFAGA